MPRALILGGTGFIGRSTARRLLAAGWQVDLAGRDPAHLPPDIAAAGGRFVAAERHDAGRLAGALGDGADLLVDCICYTAADARLLLPLLPHATSTVMISSKAVYVDAHGNHSNSDRPPRFDGPVRETQPTLPPGDMPYDTREGYGPNKVAAEQVLLESGAPVTVLRPSRVHGPGARRPREWVFVKRALDRRPVLLLARRGADVHHTTAAANIAALVETVAAKPGRRVLNSADPDAPSALEISRIIARRLGHTRREILLDDPGDGRTGAGAAGDGADPAGAGAPGEAAAPGAAGGPGELGAHPWEAPYPYVLDTSASLALGHTPAGDFAATVAAEVDWLVAAAGGGPDAEWVRRLHLDDPYFAALVGDAVYAAEDAYLATR